MNSKEIKKLFDEKRYVAVNSFLSKDQVIELIARTEKFIGDVVPAISVEEI